MEKKLVRPELLAPAGSEKAFIAAVENGADAVYVGGREFNARMNAANFSGHELVRAMDYAHKRGVKVYVTMNTLLSGEELAPALRYAGRLYENGADGLIIQDLGFGKAVRDNIPGLPIHLSTQATAASAEAVRAAEKLGYSRVVLSRELDAEKIKKIAAGVDTELEVFIHGALCICWSGQCQLSRYFGGRSGNRGMCAQPCRLPYETIGAVQAGCGRHPLSPKDLSLLDDLGSLIDAGIASFKIEGRMKMPEYVAVVTSIYRKYIDLYLAGGTYTVSEEDREALSQIFSRGGFTRGYVNGFSKASLMSGDLAKHQGIEIGKVVKRVTDTLVDVSADRALHIGDGVEIHSKDGLAGNIVSYLKENADGTLRIGDIKGKVAKGDLLFRTSLSEQMAAARATFENITYEEGKSLRRLPVKLELSQKGDALQLKASAAPGGADNERVSVCVNSAPLEPGAVPGSLDERFKAALSKTGSTPFAAEKIVIDSDITLKAKNSDLNALRREALASLEKALTVRRRLSPEEKAAVDSFAARGSGADMSRASGCPEIYFFGVAEMADCIKRFGENGGILGGFAALFPAAELKDNMGPIDDARRHFAHVIPYISNVSSGSEDEMIEKGFNDIVSFAKENSGIYIGNLTWLERFAEAGVDIRADFGLNVYNMETFEALKELGCRGFAPSLETLPTGNAFFPLMTLRYSPDGNGLAKVSRGHGKARARKPGAGNGDLQIRHRAFSDQTLLLPGRAGSFEEELVRTAEDIGKNAFARIYYRVDNA